jgi:beta-aspartyl-peptidase (threonine type)
VKGDTLGKAAVIGYTLSMNAQDPSEVPLDTADNCVLAVHGGAGRLSREANFDECREALFAALRTGYDALQRPGAASIDAVMAAVRSLEDAPCFNAGKGAAYTRDGRFELDASIMDGATRRAGAVAAVTTVKNPILAARLVMDRTPCVMLIGPAADAFARLHGAEIVAPEYFRTEMRWRMLQEKLAGQVMSADGPAVSHCGTVGCVALDGRGNLAAGTSTGGMNGKLSGRVGDSPIIGAGTLADNASCAVSVTGDGEYFMRAVAAHDIAALVQYRGLTVAEAVQIVIHDKIKPAGGLGGAIVLDAGGRLAMTYSSEGMYRGYVARDGAMQVKIYNE